MSELPTQIQHLSQPVDIPDPVATFSPEVEAEIDRHLAKYPVMRSAILPLMFIVQRERGYLDPAGVAYLANRLRLRYTDIWEVATFYSMIHTTPVGLYHIQICKTLSCKSGPDPGFITVKSGSDFSLCCRCSTEFLVERHTINQCL